MSGALMTSFCMEEPDLPVDDEPMIVVGPFDLDRMPLAVLARPVRLVVIVTAPDAPTVRPGPPSA